MMIIRANYNDNNRQNSASAIKTVHCNDDYVDDNNNNIMCLSRSDKSHTCPFSRCQVKAYDKDPPDNGGTITYTFATAPGERPKFSIDAQTGDITTRYVSTNQYCIMLMSICRRSVTKCGGGRGNEETILFRTPLRWYNTTFGWEKHEFPYGVVYYTWCCTTNV